MAAPFDRGTGEPDRAELSDPGPGPDRLTELTRLAGEAGAPELAADAAALAERLAEGRFYVACVGQFKRGKSTLLNALVGQALLPTGVVPITTAVTVVRWGARVRARVRLGAHWREVPVGDLAAYVSERGNPANEKGVAVVEVFAPSQLLAGGLCLVDTPGLGSVIAANSEATKQFVPQIDAALVVLGADPPISGDELTLVAETARHGAALVVVLNKADRLTESERREAAAFAREVLERRLGHPVQPLLEVSATERLRTGAASRDWTALERTLQTLAADAGSALIRAARTRGIARLVQRLLAELDMQRDALARPIADSERSVAALQACLADADRALNDLAHLLNADRERLRKRFEQERERFCTDTLPQTKADLAAALRQITGRREQLRHQALDRARAVAERVVKDWVRETTPAAEALYRQAVQRFAALTNTLRERLAGSTSGLTGLPEASGPESGFRTASRLYFTDLIHHTTRGPARWLLNKILPPAAARAAIERDAHGYLAQLVATNTAGVVEDLDERMLESRRRLESDIRSSLETIASSAVRALERARAHHAEGRGAVGAELARLDDLRERVAALADPGDPTPHMQPPAPASESA